MQTINKGLFTAGRLSDCDHASYIRHDVNRIRRILLLTYGILDEDCDGLLLVGAAMQLLEDLGANIDRQIERGGYAG